MTNYLTLPIGEAAPAEIDAVIEIPRGETNKELEAKSTTIKGWEDAASAREIVNECRDRYLAKNGGS